MNVELRKRLREGATDLGLTDLPFSTVRRAQQSLCEDLSNHKWLREPMRSDAKSQEGRGEKDRGSYQWKGHAEKKELIKLFLEFGNILSFEYESFIK